jgi:hypothetical protein
LVLSFLKKKFRVSDKGEISTARDIKAGKPHSSVLEKEMVRLIIEQRFIKTE